MLHSVNAVLPGDKQLHKLTAHKGQFGFYGKREREKCWCNCPPRSAASRSGSFWKLRDVSGAQSCDGSVSAACCVAVCLNTPSVLPCIALSSSHNLPSLTERAHLNKVLAKHFCWSWLQSAEVDIILLLLIHSCSLLWDSTEQSEVLGLVF